METGHGVDGCVSKGRGSTEEDMLVADVGRDVALPETGYGVSRPDVGQEEESGQG